MAAVGEWLRRCCSARSSGKSIPEAQLFRACLSHETWSCQVNADGRVGSAGKPADASCFGTGVQTLSGLQLAHALHKDVSELRLHYDSSMPPLVCSAEEAAHFRSFLEISVVETILARIHAGADLEIEAPFARLREFQAFLEAKDKDRKYSNLRRKGDDDGTAVWTALPEDKIAAALKTRASERKAEEKRHEEVIKRALGRSTATARSSSSASEQTTPANGLPGFLSEISARHDGTPPPSAPNPHSSSSL